MDESVGYNLVSNEKVKKNQCQIKNRIFCSANKKAFNSLN
jgi:hypothetical protein